MNKTALLIIDVQKGFADPYWGKRNNSSAEENIGLLLNRFRQLELTVIHIKHNSLDSNSPLNPQGSGNDFHPIVMPLPDEIQFSKTVNSAFIGTNLENHLNQQGIKTLIIVGLTTDHCVSTTVRMAANLGFNVIMVDDACACFNKIKLNGEEFAAQLVHDVHLASLNGEFCDVKTTAQVLDELVNLV